MMLIENETTARLTERGNIRALLGAGWQALKKADGDSKHTSHGGGSPFRSHLRRGGLGTGLPCAHTSCAREPAECDGGVRAASADGRLGGLPWPFQKVLGAFGRRPERKSAHAPQYTNAGGTDGDASGLQCSEETSASTCSENSGPGLRGSSGFRSGTKASQGVEEQVSKSNESLV
jgi:hypothetical protein